MDLSLKVLKKPFCLWLRDAIKDMEKKPQEMKRGWDESQLSKAWGTDVVQLFQQADALDSIGELFGGTNTKITAHAEKEPEKASSAAKDAVVGLGRLRKH